MGRYANAKVSYIAGRNVAKDATTPFYSLNLFRIMDEGIYLVRGSISSTDLNKISIYNEANRNIILVGNSGCALYDGQQYCKKCNKGRNEGS